MHYFDKNIDHWNDHLCKNNTLLVESDFEKLAQLVIVVAIYTFVQLIPQADVLEFYFNPELHLKYLTLTTLSSEYLVYHVGLDNLLVSMHQ